MRSKQKVFSNFSRNLHMKGQSLRPETEEQLSKCFDYSAEHGFLMRGKGLSYNDSCMNPPGYTIESQRLNHFLRFDPLTGSTVAQSGVSFSDLFLLHPDFIPPVIPGTVHASLAGGLANDVHGKNHPFAGSFGDQVDWVLLQTGKTLRRCSRDEYPELFHATIGGLGLTGSIHQLGIKLRSAPRFVSVNKTAFKDLKPLLSQMTDSLLHVNYQVAWLDLLHSPRALLLQAQYTDKTCKSFMTNYSIPWCPARLIHHWTMKQFNSFYFHCKSGASCVPLVEFNNPLDKIKNWTRLYGKKGLLQFQAVFDHNHAEQTIHQLLDLIRTHKATPTLAVLKLFNRTGSGLLSFCQPGFTLAIDFVHNTEAVQAVKAMNQALCEQGGKVYLAKDLFLNPEQFRQMYPEHEQFTQVLKEYNSPMQSSIGRRLGVV